MKKKILFVKPPRKPKVAYLVEKSRTQYALDLISTMKVMYPKWKLELIEIEKFDNLCIPRDAHIRALTDPLEPAPANPEQERKALKEAILSMI